MSVSDITKQAIVDTVKKLVREKPIEKISVGEITHVCGLNRNTFYYHFKDKYEIFEYVFNAEVAPLLEPYMTLEHWADSTDVLCRHMKSEKEFYTNALKSQGTNTMRELLTNYYKNFLIIGAAPHYERLGIEGDSRELVARFYSHAIIGMLCDWVAFGMKKDTDVANRIIRLAVSERFV